MVACTSGLLLLGFGLPDFIYQPLLVVAAALGAVVGWFVAAAVARTLVRLAFHRQLPEGGQLVARVGGAILVGALIYFCLPLGPGGGGGSGTNGGKGEGKGPGTDKNGPGQPGKDKPGQDKTGPDKTGQPGKTLTPADWLLIEVLENPRGEDKFYLLHRKEPARNLKEVEEFLQKNKTAFKEIHIVVTGKSNYPARKDIEEKLQELLRPPSEYNFIWRSPVWINGKKTLEKNKSR